MPELLSGYRLVLALQANQRISIMNSRRTQQVQSLHQLTPQQKEAVVTRGRDVIATAGAGSGKTRTLVSRYISLLVEGYSPLQIAAITFTEKAGREMRNRIREDLAALAAEANNEEDRFFWQGLENQMDAVRIGTIHSLCAEILRAHPAEAGVDPQFSVLEEGEALILQLDALNSVLMQVVRDPTLTFLFKVVNFQTVERISQSLLEHRLDVVSGTSQDTTLSERICKILTKTLSLPEITAPLEELRLIAGGQGLMADAGPKLTNQVFELLRAWERAQKALKTTDYITCSQTLFNARRNHMRLNIGRRNSKTKDILKNLRKAYDEFAHPWLGQYAKTNDFPLAEIEENTGTVLLLLNQLFDQILKSYNQIKLDRQVQDFDDLEDKAISLLSQSDIQQLWQNEIQHVLVDEFQDTNRRQRDIILNIIGNRSGRLFIVGDARQSIYRFRGADVTVFSEVSTNILARGGLAVSLAHTFRTHKSLLNTIDSLLIPIMGITRDDSRPYKIPYSKLISERTEPDPLIKEPYLDFVIGIGENASEGRANSSRALTKHLISLKKSGEFKSWNDIVLLFRASTGFSFYEDALDQAQIPFITIAGRGFFTRPEIRDILNIANALANPMNDTALTGLLRSPAFGLSDLALYQLHNKIDDQTSSLYEALNSNWQDLTELDKELAERAIAIIDELIPQTNRLHIADLLSMIINRLDLRAILASTSNRMTRNLDKLLETARKSQLVQVNAFLEYIQHARDIGVRAGEAPTEAQDSLRLMTIHKAKGLEFKVVVIADASYRGPTKTEPLYLNPDTGITIQTDRLDEHSLLYHYGKFLDNQQSAAENERLLYVAATRAQEKLIISGHSRPDLKTSGWLADLLGASQIKLKNMHINSYQIIRGNDITCGLLVEDQSNEIVKDIEGIKSTASPGSKRSPLYSPITLQEKERLDEEDIQGEDLLARNWRATGKKIYTPARVIGTIAHRALQNWIFPDSTQFNPFITTIARREGIVNPDQLSEVFGEVGKLLQRFQDHPLFEEITDSSVRFHEMPYTYKNDTGILDLLYLKKNLWKIVDYKTDELADKESLDQAIDVYRTQLIRYKNAVNTILKVNSSASICFLNYKNCITLIEI
jgi:ATP-dependent helicase/nuclease subunit A